MPLEFASKETSEALVAVKAMRQALVVKGVISDEELTGAAPRTFPREESDMFPLEPEIPETLDNICEIYHSREPSLISAAPLMRADGSG